MAKGEPIDDDRLASILSREESASVGFSDGPLADQVTVALKAYHGEPYGDEEDGRSQFVTRDVAEVVDYMTVAVLRAFVSGDHVVEFEGHDKAKEVTAAMHYLFLRKQKGYRLVHDWLKAGLLQKISVLKTAVEEETRVELQQGEVDALTLAQMKADGAQVVAAEIVGGDEENPVFRITVRQERRYKCFPDYHVPLDEFRFAARTVDEDTSGYLAHVCRKTRSQLVEMGFDVETVYGLPHEHGPDISEQSYSRFRNQENEVGRGNDEPATQEILLREEYKFVDRDGDGVAERVKAFRCENTILEAEEAEDQPFVVFCPFPMPGVLVGDSLADKVLDIQRLRTVTTRVTLDGFYLGIAPRTLLHEDSTGVNTIDDLLTVRAGGIVRYKGQVEPKPLQQGFSPADGLAMLEFANGERESRTGITRLNQGLDRDALNKTATGTALMQQQGAQIEEYIARNFGECLARLFSKKLKLLREFGEPFEVNIDGKMVTVDPKSWPSEMDMNVQVGLGTGRKDQRIAYRQMIIQLQAMAKEGGVPIVSPKQLFNSAAGMVADTNLGSVDEYFTDPESEEGQALLENEASKPDPEQQKLEADMQAKGAELQMRQQEGALKLELAQRDAEAKLELERQKAQQEAMLAQQKFEFEAQLAEKKMMFEAQLAEQQAARQHEVAMKSAEAKISQNRPGGSLAE